jgi:hypothetical protein
MHNYAFWHKATRTQIRFSKESTILKTLQINFGGKEASKTQGEGGSLTSESLTDEANKNVALSYGRNC